MGQSANETCEQVKARLSSLKDYQVISDFKIGDIKHQIDTWESLYPAMPYRLLAIEAYDTYGATCEALPPEKYASLYREERYYVWESRDFSDCTFNDYRGSTDSNYDREADLEQKPADVIEHEYIQFMMRIPDNHITVDVFIKPVTPVSFIRLSGVITRSGASFDEVIEDEHIQRDLHHDLLRGG